MVIKESQDKAYKEIAVRFGHNLRNEKLDAFRHCFWCALLSKKIDYDAAIIFTNAQMKRKWIFGIINSELGLVQIRY